jgi:hypothetical protein
MNHTNGHQAGAALGRAIQEMQAKQQADCARGQTGPTVCEVSKSREIPDRVEMLYAGTERLSERLAALEDRLRGVLIIHPESDTKAASPPASTGLGEMLSQLNTRIYLMTEALDSIMLRLEL